MKNKILSLTISCCIIASAALQGLAAPVKTFSVSDITGAGVSITDARFKNPKDLVFNISDLHFNVEAQKKIAAFLERLYKYYPDFELYLEGACQKSDFGWLYGNLGKSGGDAFIDALFESGNLTGAEYFAAKNNKTINPVEDKQIYIGNLALFGEIIEDRPQISRLIKPIEEKLSALRNKYFSVPQKKLFQKYSDYRAGKISDTKYFRYLQKQTDNNGINIDDYPNIALYTLVSGKTVSVSQKKLQEQMQALFARQKNTLSYKEYSALISLANNPDDRQSFVRFLYENGEKLNLSKYRQLNDFVISIIDSGKINQIELIIEEDAISREIASSSIKDANAANIFFLSQFLKIYEKVLAGSATPYEYEYYKRDKSRFNDALSQYFINDGLAELSAKEKKAERFNEANLLRNRIFTEKMFGAQKPSQIILDKFFGVEANAKAAVENMQGSRIKAVIAGGFHTGGISEILSQKQISSVNIAPKLQSPVKDDTQRYVEYAKALSYKETSAISLPNLYDYNAVDFVNIVAKNYLKIKSFLAMKDEELEDFFKAAIEAKPEIISAKIELSKHSMSASVEYQGENGKILKYQTQTPSSDQRQTKITTLGEITSAAVEKILSYSMTDRVYTTICKIVFDSKNFKEASAREFAENIKSGAHNISEILSSLTPEILNKIAISLFLNNPSVISEQDELSDVIELFRENLAIEYDDVKIVVSDTGSLIADNGWCFAALETKGRSAVLYVHKELLTAISKLDEQGAAEAAITAIIWHEIYEQAAIYGQDSLIYESFGKYLKDMGMSAESTASDVSARNPVNFHAYMKSPYFYGFLIDEASADSKGIDKKLQDQRDLLHFSEDILDSALSKHLEVESLEKIGRDFSSDQMRNLLLLRLGDKETLKKYADSIAEKIKDRMRQGGGKYVLAYRKTFPTNVIEQIANQVYDNIKENMSLRDYIDITYIEQDNYMNEMSLNPESRALALRDRLKLGEDRESFLYDSNIILIEDTFRTAALFNEETRILNRLRPQSVLPFALVDISEAAFVSDNAGVLTGSFQNDNNLQEYFFRHFFNQDFEKLKEHVILQEGHLSKYLFAAMNRVFELQRDVNASEEDKSFYMRRFDELVDYVLRSPNSDAYIKNMINDLLNISNNDLYAAGKSYSIIYRIYERLSGKTYAEKSPENFISWLIKNYAQNDDAVEQSKDLQIDEEQLENYAQKDNAVKQRKDLQIDAAQWQKFKQEPFTIIAYALMNGYCAVDIHLDDIAPSKEVDLRDAARKHGISVVEEFESEKILRRSISENEKELLKSSVLELTKELSEIRSAFDKEVGKSDFSKDAETYAEKLKELMLKAKKHVINALASRQNDPIILSDNEYSILIGGSLVKGHITSTSDIYYNVISRDKYMSQAIEHNFVPLFEYLLNEIGITIFMSEGNLDTYIGSSQVHKRIPFLGMMNIADSRGIATFLDYEELKNAGEDNGIFQKFIEEYDERILGLTSKNDGASSIEIQDMRELNIMQLMLQITEVVEPGVEIAQTGSFSRASRKNGKLTFSQNLFAQAYRNLEDKDKAESFHYRWHLRTTELMLKYLTLKYIGEDAAEGSVKSIADIPKSTRGIFQFLSERGVLNSETKDTLNADKLYNAWNVLNAVRQKKAALKKENTWTKMSEDEIKAVKLLNDFIKEQYGALKKKFPDNILDRPVRRAVDEAVEYASSDYIKYRNAQSRVEHYAYMFGDKEEYYAALMLVDFDLKELEDGYLTYNPQLQKKILNIVAFLKEINSLPSYDSLEDKSFALQNYMNLILSVSKGNPDNITAIFADRLQSMLYISGEISKVKGEIETYNEKIKNCETHISWAKRKKDKVLADIAFEEQKALEAKMEEANERLKKLKEQNAAQIKLFYTVFVPLASRLGFSHAFEYLRNMPYVREHSRKYIDTINDIKLRMGFDYDKLKPLLETLKDELNKYMSSKDVGEFQLHGRVKTIYSIIEKVDSERKGLKGGAPFDKEMFGKIEKRIEKESLEEHHKKELKVRLDKQAANIQDLIGFHIVVTNASERDKIFAALDNFFSGDGDFKITSVKYESEAQKGFTRYKYAVSYKNDTILEIVVFSKEQYENEVWANIPAYAVKYALAHVYYKLGLPVYVTPYGDNIIGVEINLKQFDLPADDTKTQFFKIDDDVTLTAVKNSRDLKSNLNAISSASGKKGLDYSYALINDDGKERIIAYPKDATAFDIISSVAFAPSGRKVLKTAGGEIVSGQLPESPADGSIMRFSLEPVSAKDVVEYKGDHKTMRAKVLTAGNVESASEPDFLKSSPEREKALLAMAAHYEGQNVEKSYENSKARWMAQNKPIKKIQPEDFGLDDNVDISAIIADMKREKAIFVMKAHYGLKDVKELYAAFKAKYISQKEIEDFLKAQNEHIAEIQTEGLGLDDNVDVRAVIENLNADGKYNIEFPSENQLEPSKFQSGVKVIFKGSQDELNAFLSEVYNLPELAGKLRQNKNSESGSVYFANKRPDSLALLGIIALGQNIGELLSLATANINLTAAAIETSKYLIDMFNEAIVESLAKRRELINAKEERLLLKKLQGYFPDASGVDLVITDNPELIRSKKTYAFATLGVNDNKVTLYVHKSLLERMKRIGGAKRERMLEQLVAHEAEEYYESLNKGEGFDIDKWHKGLLENPEQKKLMNYAARTAESVVKQRQKLALAQEIADSLSQSEKITKQNSPDVILLLGNDETETFDKAAELYKENPAKIYVLGGQGRLTQALKQKLGIEGESEAEIMKEYLISKGVPSKDIFVEDRSTNTKENLENVKKEIT
ncbi:MAG: YdcF family protein, partial [Endomicrobium sp.]|nr:YdcF family protein [Endomicrobium sp.]